MSSTGTRQSTSGRKLSFGQCNSSRNLQTISKFDCHFLKQKIRVKVNWVDVPSAMETKILTAVSAKTAPDVVNLNLICLQLATRNAWLDLNAKVPADLRSTHTQYLESQHP